MPIKNLLQEIRKFEIEAFKMPTNIQELKKTHVPFAGSPLKHPYDSKKVVLVPDPYSSSHFYYEFKISDVNFAEKLPSIVNIEGETIPVARFWVKKRSLALLCKPFVVEETKS